MAAQVACAQEGDSPTVGAQEWGNLPLTVRLAALQREPDKDREVIQQASINYVHISYLTRNPGKYKPQSLFPHLLSFKYYNKKISGKLIITKKTVTNLTKNTKWNESTLRKGSEMTRKRHGWN
ncbi:hypothetical protein E2C01_012202 [Portunus trituberculatus]|uniref:Uncharacterized protein n=1 Tax=Portunus trituberculatus TaxID=210409 RepID=A0A5B7DD33_PORTR|nr:hypothetical protein [Portunus trituberculatus]